VCFAQCWVELSNRKSLTGGVRPSRQQPMCVHVATWGMRRDSAGHTHATRIRISIVGSFARRRTPIRAGPACAASSVNVGSVVRCDARLYTLQLELNGSPKIFKWNQRAVRGGRDDPFAQDGRVHLAPCMWQKGKTQNSDGARSGRGPYRSCIVGVHRSRGGKVEESGDRRASPIKNRLEC
jgi:hypothetical protein